MPIHWDSQANSPTVRNAIKTTFLFPLLSRKFTVLGHFAVPRRQSHNLRDTLYNK